MRFGTIAIDPPWNEQGGGRIKRGADRHYPLIKNHAAMVSVVLGSGFLGQMAENSHCYLWVTNNHLADGLALMAAIGFRYVTNVVWVKPSYGLGQYFRGQHELCLFGVRGRGLDACVSGRAGRRRDLPSVFRAPKGRHSQKPAEFFDLVEARSSGPYVELFAREPRLGWTTWGNEVSLQ